MVCGNYAHHRDRVGDTPKGLGSKLYSTINLLGATEQAPHLLVLGDTEGQIQLQAKVDSQARVGAEAGVCPGSLWRVLGSVPGCTDPSRHLSMQMREAEGRPPTVKIGPFGGRIIDKLSSPGRPEAAATCLQLPIRWTTAPSGHFLPKASVCHVTYLLQPWFLYLLYPLTGSTVLAWIVWQYKETEVPGKVDSTGTANTS